MASARSVFIVSTGRTGTRFLARYLDANFEEVEAVHEPAPLWRMRLASNAYLQGAIGPGPVRALLGAKRRRGVERSDAGLYVESNPVLAGCASLLPEVFEGAVLVHVVRDPREHARSSLNHGTSTGLKGIANRWLPFWYPDVGRLLDVPGPLDWLGRAAGLWSVVNRALREAAPRFAASHVIRYEDLFDAEASGLRGLCECLGLPYRESELAVSPRDRINAAALDVLPPWREWSEAQRALVRGLCGPLMAEYGYGEEPEWTASAPR